MNKIAIICSSDKGVILGRTIQKEFQKAALLTTRASQFKEVQTIISVSAFMENNFKTFDAFIFIGALGICVRSIAPYIESKLNDPAVINMDDEGKFVQPVLSGHIGGANQLAKTIARTTGGLAVITTASDNQGIWALDTLAQQFNWINKSNTTLNKIIALFVNNKPTAVLLDVKDKGTAYLEQSKPDFVTFYYDFSKINFNKYELFIAVTYKTYTAPVPSLYYYAKVLSVGMGCSRDIETDLLLTSVKQQLAKFNLAHEAVKAIGSIVVKQDETAFLAIAKQWDIPLVTYTADQLNTMQVSNPSDVVKAKLGVYSVSEAAVMLMSNNKELLLEKQKLSLASGKKHTIAIALDKQAQRKASIAIVGAGPGDAELISVKGKILLENADLILYAGSLIPEELTHYAKPGAIVRNSAGMTLEEQLFIMEAHYNKGDLIVRLQSGDPSIYGAIQEQMSLFDEKQMDYFIVPGISSFQAAAAYLKSEFTIPEVVQSIILTRGEGNTPLPQSEKLNEMAKHKATMCIFLSATIAKTVQTQLLEHYPENTPVAVLYRVTWKDEQVYTGELGNLSKIIREYKLTRTVLIIVGAAIGARKNRSQLYHPEWKHIFRTGKEILLKN